MAELSDPASQGSHLEPAHCLDAFDCRDYSAVVGDECSPAKHERLDEAEAALASWLKQALTALRASGAGWGAVPSPRPGQPDIPLASVDASTAHLFLAAGQRGSEVVDVLYVGLVCQGLNGAWQGIAGFFLPTCSTCDASGWKTVGRVTRLLPPGTTELAAHDLPDDLAPRSGWWDDRLFKAVRLPTALPGTWVTDTLSAVSLDSGEAALVRIGPLTASMQNLVLVSDQAHLSLLASHLGLFQGREPRVTYRRGASPVVASLAGSGPGVPPVRAELRHARTAPPSGWAVVEIVEGERTRSVTLVRSATAYLRALRASRELDFDLDSVTLWTAPRVAERGAVDWDGLLALLAECQVQVQVQPGNQAPRV